MLQDEIWGGVLSSFGRPFVECSLKAVRNGVCENAVLQVDD